MSGIETAVDRLMEIIALEIEQEEVTGLSPMIKIKLSGFNSGAQTPWMSVSRNDIIEWGKRVHRSTMPDRYEDDPVRWASHQDLVMEALRDGRLVQAVIELRNSVPGQISIYEAKQTIEALKKTL